MLGLPTTSLPRVVLRWIPDGRRKRGRLKETWRKTVEREMKVHGWTWGFLESVAATTVGFSGGNLREDG